MTSCMEPERINTGRGLRFAARPRACSRIQDTISSRCNSSGGLVTAVGGAALPTQPMSFLANRPNGLPLETSLDLDFDPRGL